MSAPARRQLVRYIVGCGLSERRSLRVIGMSASALRSGTAQLAQQGAGLVASGFAQLQSTHVKAHAVG